MRTIVSGVLAMGVGLGALASTANAQLQASDSFDYTAGTGGLTNQNGGTGWTSNWGGGVNDIVSPGLTFTKNGQTLASAGNTAQTDNNNNGNFRTLPGVLSTGTEYVSFLARLGSGTAGGGYAGVSLFNGTGTEALFIGQPSTRTVWGLDQSTGPQLSTVAVDGTTHLLVAQIQFGAGAGGTDHVNLYIDPTPGLSAPDVAAALSADTTRSASFDRVRIQSGNGQAPVQFDELRIGTTFGSVDPAAVPEPATLGLAAIGGLSLLARKRRA